jgi:predicted metalloprotease with PDZ domain
MISRRATAGVLLIVLLAVTAVARRPQDAATQEKPKRIDATPTRSDKAEKAKKKARVDATPTRGIVIAPPEAAAPVPQPATTISVAVDATDAPRRVFHTTLVVPATSGSLQLYYPKWLPGDHGPSGPLNQIAGLKISAQGRPLAWDRDPVDNYAIRVDVPQGVSSVTVNFDYLLPSSTDDVMASAAATSQLAILTWNLVVLYPRGAASDDVTYAPSLKLPQGWKYGTSLTASGESGGVVTFAPVSLTTLVDSPVLIGRTFKTIQLSSQGAPANVVLDMAAESDAALAIPADVLQGYKNLVAETEALFGAHHFRSYHFLLALSDNITGFGLEHHESSDNRTSERALVDENERRDFITLLPHEYVHSWNGKYRRPAGLATGNYHDPMKDEMLWIYEGLTEYLGVILTARSGLHSLEDFREDLASVAARLDTRSGRSWRPNQDTATAASFLYLSSLEWSNYRRSVDFYDEGVLLWLDVDTTIRQLTNGAKSIEDFCRAFHGAPTTGPAVKTYTFDDVVAGLQAVAPNDWRAFLRSRLDSTDSHANLGGISNAGWKLEYSEKQNANDKAYEVVNEKLRLQYSLGLLVKEDGTVVDASVGMPAYQAGVSPGMKIVAVNGRRFSPEGLREALAKAKTGSEPIELLVENAEFYKTLRVDYRGGERSPHLVRDSSKPDLLEAITKPLAPRK